MIRQYELIFTPRKKTGVYKILTVGFLVHACSEEEAISICLNSLNTPEDYIIEGIENLAAYLNGG